MKSFIKIISRVYNYKKHSDKFATGSIKVSEKNQKGEYDSVFISLKIFNPVETIHEKVDYTITGTLGVSPAYNQYPEKVAINVKTIELTKKVEAPVSQAEPQQFPDMEQNQEIPF